MMLNMPQRARGVPVAPVGAPAWLASQSVGTWVEVPATNTIKDIDPSGSATYNPVYPSAPEWGGGTSLRNIMSAWCSGAMNPATGDIYAWGGGHADYGGNEPYKLNVYSSAPTWQMLHPPSGSIGFPITDGALSSDPAIIAASATGLYSDGRPRPTHTYNSILYVPGKGLSVMDLFYVYPHVNGPQKAYRFNEGSNDWQLLCDYTALSGANSAGGGTCYDSFRNCVWILGGGAFNMVKVDCATGIATRHGTIDNHAQSPLLHYDSELDLVYIVSTSNSGGWLDYPSRMSVFDPSTNLFHVTPSYTGSLPESLAITSHAVGWDQESKRLLLWNYGGTRTLIGTLARPSNPRTTAWTAGTLTLSGSNAVTPSAPQVNGTFQRFNYVPKLGGCLLINAYDQKPYFFKMKESA